MADDYVTVETLLGEMRHWCRRRVLAFFIESDSCTVHIDELVEYIRERDGATCDPDCTAVELHHRALPALAEAGLVDYDWETHTVRYLLGPRLGSALSLLEKMEEDPECEC